MITFQRCSCYRADMTMHLKPSRGNNSESMKARVVILVRDTSTWPVLHNCELSWLYSKGYSSYRADTNMHLKASKERCLKKYSSEGSHFCTRHIVMTCFTLLWSIIKIFQTVFKLQSVHENVYGWMYGRPDGWTPGSSLYPPNLSVGDKKVSTCAIKYADGEHCSRVSSLFIQRSMLVWDILLDLTNYPAPLSFLCHPRSITISQTWGMHWFHNLNQNSHALVLWFQPRIK